MSKLPEWTVHSKSRMIVLTIYVIMNVMSLTALPWARNENGEMEFNTGIWVMLIEMIKLGVSICLAAREGTLQRFLPYM